ncbi:MAG TPA: mannose-1-phosphate guanylyltransferase [Bacteroidales bacterium]|nr:mannose-1-phosphate guanylyltransferase [Bacteroidales bacterium]
MNKNNYCVIMAGGVGARFWPLSRTNHPKQFIDILGTGETLIQQTFRRLTASCPPENIYVVTHENYRNLVLKQLPDVDPSKVLYEPVRRNTAPCIAYACHKIAVENPAANIVVAPSDHIILREDVFTSVINLALGASEKNDWLITLGITPSRPDTGYGYIQFNDSVSLGPEGRLNKVITFTEKPQYDLAVKFLQSGDFLWNSGIFIWSVKSILQAFEKHLPEVDSLFREGIKIYGTPAEKEFVNKAYTLCKSISIDYGVMEKADNVYVVAADFGWSDLGTWSSLYDARQKNEHGNSIQGANVLTWETQNSIILMPGDKVAVIDGLNDYIVAEDDNLLLICRRGDEQRIREFVETVKIEKGDKFV